MKGKTLNLDDGRLVEVRLHSLVANLFGKWWDNSATCLFNTDDLVLLVSLEGFGELGADNPDVKSITFLSHGHFFQVQPCDGLVGHEIAIKF